MLKVLVLTVGDRETGSTQYRIVQYESFLRSHGVELRYVHRDEVNRATVGLAAEADVLLNQKCLLRTCLTRRIIRRSRRVLFDFDDAIYTRPGRPRSWWTELRVRRRLHLWLRSAHAVTVPNEFLATYARRYTESVHVIPMALDLREWVQRPAAGSREVSIGWAGSPGNLVYLEGISGPLKQVLSQNPNARFLVFSGQRPNLPFPFDHHPYQPGAEPGFIRRLDIGLLPLPEEEHARGKSPIKALQYLACGVPVVGNMVGATGEILNPENSIAVQTADGWRDALNELIGDPARIWKMGLAGRRLVESRHSLDGCGKALLSAMLGGQYAPEMIPS